MLVLRQLRLCYSLNREKTMKRSLLILIGLALFVAEPALAQNFGCFGRSGDCKTVIENGRKRVICCGGHHGRVRADKPRRWEGSSPREWEGQRDWGRRDWDGPRRWQREGCFGRSGDCKTVKENGRKVVICCR